MGGTMVTKSLTREQKDYCITECPRGKKKMQELLATCESVLDAAIDMQSFTQDCFESSECSASSPTKKAG